MNEQNVGLSLDYGEKYVFIAEWFDSTAEITKRFLLSFFPSDHTLELYDLQCKRLFLRRTKVEGISLKSLYRGSIVSIYARHIRIVDYASNSTQRVFHLGLQKIFFLIKPDGVSHLGDIICHLEKRGFSLTRLKMGTLSKDAVLTFLGNQDAPLPHEFVASMSGGPSIGIEAIGENGRIRWLEAVGPCDPDVAKQEAPDSLRASYGTDILRNAIHISENDNDMLREADFWFSQGPGSTHQISSSCEFSNSTCCVIKPHALQEGLVGAVLNYIKDHGFRITGMSMFHLNRPAAEEFYEVYKGVLPEYSSMVTHLTSGPCIAMELVEANNPQNTPIAFRELSGPNDPLTARKLRPDSIRAKFGTSTVLNGVHCTDLPDDAKLEVEYFFKILSR